MAPGSAKLGWLLATTLLRKTRTSVARFQLQAGHVEDHQAAGVVGGEVVVDVGVRPCFRFRCRRRCGSARQWRTDDAAALADVEAGVGSADGDAFFDQHVRTLHGIEAVGAVGGGLLAGPFDAHVADGDVAGAEDFHGVAGGVFDGEAFEREVVAGRFDPLAAGGLAFEGEDSFRRDRGRGW